MPVPNQPVIAMTRSFLVFKRLLHSIFGCWTFLYPLNLLDINRLLLSNPTSLPSKSSKWSVPNWPQSFHGWRGQPEAPSKTKELITFGFHTKRGAYSRALPHDILVENLTCLRIFTVTNGIGGIVQLTIPQYQTTLGHGSISILLLYYYL